MQWHRRRVDRVVGTGTALATCRGRHNYQVLRLHGGAAPSSASTARAPCHGVPTGAARPHRRLPPWHACQRLFVRHVTHVGEAPLDGSKPGGNIDLVGAFHAFVTRSSPRPPNRGANRRRLATCPSLFFVPRVLSNRNIVPYRHGSPGWWKVRIRRLPREWKLTSRVRRPWRAPRLTHSTVSARRSARVRLVTSTSA